MLLKIHSLFLADMFGYYWKVTNTPTAFFSELRVYIRRKGIDMIIRASATTYDCMHMTKSGQLKYCQNSLVA